MTRETRIELIVVLVSGLVVGSWVGFKLVARSAQPGPVSSKGTEANSVSSQTNRPRVMTATPGEPVMRPAIIKDEPIRDPGVAPPPAVNDADVERAKALIAQGKKHEARAILTSVILACPEGRQREYVRSLLGRINAELFFSPRTPSPDMEFYDIQGGDVLSHLATRRFGRDVYFKDLLCRINRIRDENRIRVGQRLKAPKGTFSARVERSRHRMIVFLNGHYIKEYSVAVGAPGSETPLAVFTVANTKQVDPAWTAPDGNVYPHGHPKNILGSRWIGFENTDYSGFGIHGTTDASSVGKSISNGCIRMLKDDVEEVFGMLMPGEKVTVVE